MAYWNEVKHSISVLLSEKLIALKLLKKKIFLKNMQALIRGIDRSNPVDGSIRFSVLFHSRFLIPTPNRSGDRQHLGLDSLLSFWNLSRNIQIVRPEELIWWLKMQCGSMRNDVARWMGPLNFNVRSTKYLNSQSFSWRSNWSSNKLNQWKLKLVTARDGLLTLLHCIMQTQGAFYGTPESLRCYHGVIHSAVHPFQY